MSFTYGPCQNCEESPACCKITFGNNTGDIIDSIGVCEECAWLKLGDLFGENYFRDKLRWLEQERSDREDKWDES